VNANTLVFLDSNIFIYSQVEFLPEYVIAVAKLEEARKKKWEIGINAIFLSESFYVITRFLGREEAFKRLSLFLQSSQVIYLSIEKNTVLKAMELAVKHSQRINDMILAQHAIDSKADGLLIDNVKHFEGISGLKIFGLR
jgi:predicted nucleic acid-binding protein